MERPRGFFTKRSEHYNNIQKEENNKKKSLEQNASLKEPEKTKQEQLQSPKVENLDPNKAPPSKPNKQNERPLKCLETLAQKAGITFDEKYEMEKSQSPAQQVQQQQAQQQQSQQQQQQQQQQTQIQFTPEQYQQLQYQQIQQAFANAGQSATIQVKQEYATQQQNHGISASDLKTLQDHQNQQMQQIIVQESSPQSPHQNSMQQQVPAEWQHGRVQVLQQPLQNTQYIPQMYSPVVMSNLLHGGLGQQQQIQVITGKPFQNQLTNQMLAGGKPVITSGGQATFGTYTLPTMPSSQNQAVLFSPVNLNIQQQNQQGTQQILPNMQNQSTPTKSDAQKQLGGQKILQKVSQGSNGQQQQTVTQSVANQNNQSNQQCVQVSQTMPTAQLLSGQTMQFAAPWQLQGMTPFWTNNIQPQTLLTTNPIFIRGTNPDGSPGMFIQQSPTQNTQQTVQSPHNQISLVSNITQTPTQKVRPASDNNLTPKTPQAQQRTAPILPHGAQIRPASSVSTQTAMNQNANLLSKAPKVRTKQTPVRPAANIKVQLNQQTGQPTMMQQIVQTPGSVSKMVVMGNINGQFTPVLQQNAAQQIQANNDKLKSQQQQQQIIQQAILQQNQYQQQIAAQIQLQQQQQQYIQQHSQNQLMAQGGNIQQVLLQQQLPTVTVTSGVSLQQAMPNVNQQSVMTKAGQVIQLQPVTSQSVPTSMANTQIVTSMAGSMSADTSNSILGPLTSPQTPLQPPQNPLIAMTTLSASPMSNVGVQKEKVDAASGGDSQKISMSVTMSPMKRQAEESKQNEAKKQMTEETKKSEESTNNTSSNTMMSPSVNKTQSAPGTPTSSTKPTTLNSPLAAQNGESDAKKSTSNASTNVPMLKNELPKAMVKPNVLTHVIEGYVIQESNEPFPVTRQRYSEKENDEPPKKKQAVEDTKSSDTLKINGDAGTTSNVVPSSAPPLATDMIPCEHCGKQEMRGKLKKKRFCSLTCAKATKSASTDSPNVSIGNGDEKSSTPSTPNDKSKLEAESDVPAVEEHVMLKWSVAQVCDFIKNLPGCTDYAEDFKLQEIDGQALLLLKENHLVSAMGMKLGPALKIVNKIESMRVSKEGETTETPPDQQ